MENRKFIGVFDNSFSHRKFGMKKKERRKNKRLKLKKKNWSEQEHDIKRGKKNYNYLISYDVNLQCGSSD